VGVKVCGRDVKAEPTKLANHMAATRPRLQDWPFDLDRTAQCRDDPWRVDCEVLVVREAIKSRRRDVT
jgi:hypothetical protein